MKPLEIVLAFAILLVLLAASFGGGAFWQYRRVSLPDTVRTVEYVKVPVQVGTATPKPIIRYVRDTVRIQVHDTLGGVLVSHSDYDSLTVPRSWEIESEYIGKLELNYDPLERILTYTHTPAPIKIETVEVTRDVPVSFWKKLEYVAIGAGIGVVAGLTLSR